jgi:hypothetical protein
MRARLLTIGIVTCALAGIGGAGWYAYRHSGAASEAQLLARLPVQDAVVVSIDFAALRSSGLLDKLAPSKAAEEPEYASFVRETGLAYQRDLDRAVVAFAPDGTFFVVQGRFDWKRLQDYARNKSGSCFNELCRMTGSQPDRRISYLPLNRHLMALAVSQDDLAASRLQNNGPQRVIAVPPDPIWISIPAATWKRGNGLPAGAKLFVSAIGDADQVMITLGEHNGGLEARLEATCHSTQDATTLAVQLQKATLTLRDVLAQQHNDAKPDELGMLLTSGVFAQNGNRVTGRWPLQKAFMDSLLAGI